MTTILRTDTPAATTADVLRRHGFEPARTGGHRRGTLVLARSGPWWRLAVPAGEKDGAPRDPALPGPWKRTGAGPDGQLVFTWPADGLQDGREIDEWDDSHEDGEAMSPFEAGLIWALTTLAREVPHGWSAPDDDRLAIGDAGLTIRRGSILRQIEVLRDARFALRVPLAGPLPEALPDRRVQWLRALLRDAHHRWTLVRCGLRPDRRATAEIDLTGMPASLAPRLLPAALASLRGVTAAVAETAGFLADPAARSEIFECRGPA